MLAVALLTSRLTLILHELVGHGALAIAFGSPIADFRLLLFGGGWIRYAQPERFTPWQAQLVALGGVGLELLVGGVLLLAARWARRGSVARVALLAFAAIDIVHAGFYLACGIFHGFGDGRGLYRLLGERRWALVGLISIALLGAAYWLARRVAGAVRSWLVGHPRGLLTFGQAVLLAGAGHASLTALERSVRPDETRDRIMQRQSERAIERALSAYQATERAQGRTPDRAALAAERARQEALHRELPLRWLLGVLLVLSLASGAHLAFTGPDPPPEPSPGWSDLVPIGAAVFAALLLIGALQTIAGAVSG